MSYILKYSYNSELSVDTLELSSHNAKTISVAVVLSKGKLGQTDLSDCFAFGFVM